MPQGATPLTPQDIARAVKEMLLADQNFVQNVFVVIPNVEGISEECQPFAEKYDMELREL